MPSTSVLIRRALRDTEGLTESDLRDALMWLQTADPVEWLIHCPRCKGTHVSASATPACPYCEADLDPIVVHTLPYREDA